MRIKMFSSLRSKIMFSGILLTAIPLIVIGLATLRQNRIIVGAADEESRGLGYADLDHVLRGVYGMIASQQEVLQQKVVADLNVAANELEAVGGVKFGDKKVEWRAKNQFTGAERTFELPQMLIGRDAVSANTDMRTPSPLVDKVQKMVGGTCTVFQRMDEAGDMLRVATNVQTLEGRRAIGTYIPATNPDGASNPIVAKILRGESFQGRAFVVNSWYITAYSPIRDASGKIVGMLYTGVDEDTAKSMRKTIITTVIGKTIITTVIGKTGYVFVLNRKGEYIVSPGGSQDGKSLIDVKDSSGRYFVRDMVAKALALKDGEITEERYPWKGKDDPAPRMKTTRLMYYPEWDWIIGAGSYDDEFLAASRRIEKTNKEGMMVLAGVFVMSVAASVVLWWLMSSYIAAPISRAAEIAGSLASQSEELSSISGNLMSSMEEMGAQANNVAAATEEMSHNINSMASASEEMNVNAQNVAGASEQMSHNMSNIAGAIEELSSSMSTVSGNADTGTKIAADAMKHSAAATETMNKLGTAAQEIGQVTEVIKRIAEQTNLLALNATIEAASAGSAGKGFAVVANEIKELASQSANAAEDIAKKIKGIQNQTGDAVKVISEVSEIIGKLNESVDVISKLVIEQGKATNDMSRNVGEANSGVNNITHAIKEVAEGTREMSRNAGEAAKGANDVSANIGEVKTAVGHGSSNASQVNVSATDLSKLAGELNGIVKKIRGE